MAADSAIFDDVITANRNLVRTFEYLSVDEDGIEGDPIDLENYNRLIYNLQTGDATPVEILTVDSDVDDADWLKIVTPTSLGTIKMNIPGSALVWTPSDRGNWIHELVLLDGNGGLLPFFNGNVLYKRPTVLIS